MVSEADTLPKYEGSNKRKREANEQNRSSKEKRRKSKHSYGGKSGTGNEGGTLKKQVDEAPTAAWRLSGPMGGRMCNLDPIFPDEEHLIITYNTSVQVYTTADSLVVRRIPFPAKPSKTKGSQRGHPIAAVLSETCPNFVWVGYSDGHIWQVDWQSGSIEDFGPGQGRLLLDMTIQVVRVGEKPLEVIIASEKVGETVQVVAYNLASESRDSLKLHTHDADIQNLQAVGDGAVLAASAGRTLLLGSLKSQKLKTFGDLRYRFFSLALGDEIACLDLRSSTRRSSAKRNSLSQTPASPVVDIVIGFARGAISIYGDVLPKLQELGVAGSRGGLPQPLRYHWHRRCVHSVKWSRDGHYFISGGTETVLVLWQTDTGKREFLPHLGACIENIVVSPRGSSYAVHLDDNSTMVLSTAEMKPTTYISGIQSMVLSETRPKDWAVHRTWRPVEEISTPLAALINPADPSRMLLCVGSRREAGWNGGSSLLQTFDIASFQTVSKQPLARTTPTDVNVTLKGVPLTEPAVTHVSLSQDARWLATVDEWQPPQQDMEALAADPSVPGHWARGRREIYLKFWELLPDAKTYELVSRINEAHFTSQTEPILSMVADKRSKSFITLGGDGMVRFWTPKLQQRDGLPVTGQDGRPLSCWSCSRATALGETIRSQNDAVPFDTAHESSQTGALAFSEDGSTLFVAFGSRDEVVLYILDGESGEIRSTLHDLIRGHVRGIGALSSSLIMLSDDLRVYDIVADELRYGIRLENVSAAARPMAHLAVDHRSCSFAVAIPCLGFGHRKLGKAATSELAVFSPEQCEPLFVRKLPNLVTSLLPNVASAGFVVVDSAAQIWSIGQPADPLPLARPLADLNLDTVAAADSSQERAVVGLGDREDDEEGSDIGDENETEMPDVEDYDIHNAVVAPQRLTDIFDAAPAFAMPPIEDLFYQVAGLLSKPLAAAPA